MSSPPPSAPSEETISQLSALHGFWYGEDSQDWPVEAQLKNWFGSSEEFDQQIQSRFASLPRDMKEREQEFDGCLADPVAATGLILCFDQLPRNIFRRQAEAFAYDGLAIALAEKLSGSEVFARLTPSQKLFALMPYQHVEDRALQDKSVALFDAFAASAPAEARQLGAGMAEYARKHRDVVARFGRFPHRNEALGRATTPAEQSYLAEGAERFGQ